MASGLPEGITTDAKQGIIVATNAYATAAFNLLFFDFNTVQMVVDLSGQVGPESVIRAFMNEESKLCFSANTAAILHAFILSFEV